jgi:SH3-like domain-containing protein
MKKVLFFAMMLVAVAAAQAGDNRLWAYIDDKDSTTNLRNAPGGRVVAVVINNAAHEVVLDKPTNGWWQVYEVNNVENPDDTTNYLVGSDTGRYWIHSSVVGFDTRNYGTSTILPLRAKPSSDARVTHRMRGEHHVSPIDVDGDWVKVRTADGHEGWLEQEWICPNPLTTCP